jgi:hypothetical protein
MFLRWKEGQHPAWNNNLMQAEYSLMNKSGYQEVMIKWINFWHLSLFKSQNTWTEVPPANIFSHSGRRSAGVVLPNAESILIDIFQLQSVLFLLLVTNQLLPGSRDH